MADTETRLKDTRDFEFLMKLYDECQIQRRHHETYRATLTGVIVSLYVALISCFGGDVLSLKTMLVILLVLSIFGILCTISYTERYNLYWKRSQVIRAEIAKRFTDVNLDELFKNAKNYKSEEKCENRWPQSVPCFMRHHRLWLFLHIIMCAFTLYTLLHINNDGEANISQYVNNVTINIEDKNNEVKIDTVALAVHETE